MKFEEKDNQFVITGITFHYLLDLRKGMIEDLKELKHTVHNMEFAGINRKENPLSSFITELENDIADLERFIEELKAKYCD